MSAGRRCAPRVGCSTPMTIASTASSAGSVSTRLRVVLGDVTRRLRNRTGPAGCAGRMEGLRRTYPPQLGRRRPPEVAVRPSRPAGALPGRLPPMTDATSALPDPGLRHSPLHERHVALGAKFAAFGGWEMPLEYAGGGVLREHTAVRERGRRLRRVAPGQGAGRRPRRGRLRQLLPDQRPGAASVPGRRSTRFCCDDATGGVVDDLIAYRVRRRRRLPDPERGQHRRGGPPAARRRARRASPSTDQHDAYAVLAVQGPRSAELLTALGLPAGHDYMSFAYRRLRRRAR